MRGLAYLAYGNLAKGKQDLDIFKKYESSLHSEMITNKKTTSLNPFPMGSRICS